MTTAEKIKTWFPDENLTVEEIDGHPEKFNLVIALGDRAYAKTFNHATLEPVLVANALGQIVCAAEALDRIRDFFHRDEIVFKVMDCVPRFGWAETHTAREAEEMKNYGL